MKPDHNIFKNAPVALFHISSSGSFIQANPKFIRVLGYESIEDFFNYVSSLNDELYADPKEFGKILDFLRKQGDSIFQEARWRQKSGQLIDIELHLQKESDADGLVYIGSINDISERKRALDTKVFNEERYRSIFENSNDAILIFDGQTVVEANLKAKKMFAVPLDSEFPQNPRKTAPRFQPDGSESQKLGQYYTMEVLKGNPQLFEWMHKRLNGKEFLTEVSLSKINNDPKSRLFLSVIRDISDRVMAQNQLQESEERYRSLIEFSPDGIITMTLTGKIISVNAAFVEFGGYSKEDFEGKFFWKIPTLIPQSLKTYLGLFTKVIDQKIEREIQFRWKHKSGEIKYGNARVKFVTSNHGKFVLGIIRNVTDQVHSENKIKKSEALLANVVNCLPFNLVVVNKDNELILQNNNSKHFWGDFNDKDFNPGPELYKKLENFKDKMKKVLTGMTLDYEFQFNNPRLNKQVDFRSVLTPLYIDDDIEGVINLNIDITAKKLAEQQLKDKNEEYLRLTEELRQSLDELKNTNIQLEEARQKAEESDRLKSAFLANMSHEIRTPMNGIIGFSKRYLNDGLSDDKRQEYANIVIDSSRQLLSIVNDILDMSVIETGKLEIHNEEVHINHLLMETLNFYKPNVENRDISIILEKGLPDTESVILTDKTRLQQILSNLLNNALKFTQRGQIRFGYEIGEDNTMLCFYVEDTGIGIAKEQQSAIFNSFQQEDSTTAQLYGGTGLGLAISHKLVNLMGGKIWVESEKRKGSKFSFTIPLNPFGNVPVKDHEEQHESNRNFKDFTILIAEDEAINYLYLESVLEELDINLIHARDGREAVAFCRKNSEIDLVLMDIKMPVMNGYEATQKIKELRPDLPIIAQTAYAMSEDKGRAIDAGCDGYLFKPIDEQDLVNYIGQYLNKSTND